MLCSDILVTGKCFGEVRELLGLGWMEVSYLLFRIIMTAHR